MLRVNLATALLVAVAIAPSAARAVTDPPSPVFLHDNASATQDLRSPDARDAGVAAEAPATQDLRSPDARDAGRAAAAAPAEAGRVSPKRSAPSVADRFEWSDAGIGAAVMLALVSVAGGTLLLISRSRQRAPTA
jgi:hypothetical protein